MTARYCDHSGKVIHASAADARRAALHIGKGAEYHCPHCDGYHHTRQSKSEQQGIRKALRNRYDRVRTP